MAHSLNSENNESRKCPPTSSLPVCSIALSLKLSELHTAFVPGAVCFLPHFWSTAMRNYDILTTGFSLNASF
jgi:hypothetical protein